MVHGMHLCINGIPVMVSVIGTGIPNSTALLPITGTQSSSTTARISFLHVHHKGLYTFSIYGEYQSTATSTLSTIVRTNTTTYRTYTVVV